jgi:hypothetical protein
MTDDKHKPIHVYQLWHESDKPIPQPYAECIERTRSTPWIDKYELVRFAPEPGVPAWSVADHLRLRLAQLDPHALFLDADLYFTGRPSFDLNALPYFNQLPGKQLSGRARAKVRGGQGRPPAGNRPHISAFYVNGCCEWFAALRLPPVPPVKRGWTNALLKTQPSHPIPKGIFFHAFAAAAAYRLPPAPRWSDE